MSRPMLEECTKTGCYDDGLWTEHLEDATFLSVYPEWCDHSKRHWLLIRSADSGTNTGYQYQLLRLCEECWRTLYQRPENMYNDMYRILGDKLAQEMITEQIAAIPQYYEEEIQRKAMVAMQRGISPEEVHRWVDLAIAKSVMKQ